MVSGGELRAARRCRGWDVREAVRHLREVSGEPLPDPRHLAQTWRSWERGTRPRERYALLLRKLFSIYPPDPAAVLEQAARVESRRLDGLEAAAVSSGRPGLAELAGRSAELRLQIAERAAQLAELVDRAARMQELLDEAARDER